VPIIKCKQCFKSFYAKPSWLQKGMGKYCSAQSHHFSMRNGEWVHCFTCTKKIYKPLKALTHSKSGHYFCGKSCQTTWRNKEFVGRKHANWIHGRASYKSVLSRHNIVKMCTLCKSVDIRVLAVHHVDQNRMNNALSNLAWLCHNCHHLVHYDKVEKRNFNLEFKKLRL